MPREYIQTQRTFGSVPVRGDILLFDEFNGNLTWTQAGTAIEQLTRLDPLNKLSGDFSCHLQTRIATPAINDSSSIEKNIYLLDGKIIAIEITFMLVEGGSPRFEISFEADDGTNIIKSNIRYSTANARWENQTGATAFTAITGASINLEVNTWHFIKYQFNIDSLRYTQFVNDNLVITPTNLTIFTETNGEVDRKVRIAIAVTAETAVRVQAKVDSVLIYQP